MKKLTVLLCSAIVVFTACNKNSSLENQDASTSVTTAELTAVAAVSVGTTITDASLQRSGYGTKDSLYAVNCYNKGQKVTTINFSSLLSAITTYLSTNYSGYTAIKAAQISDTTGSITGFVAVINYNGKPVAIKFDASGNFVKVLEQRQGFDIHHGNKFHQGGFCDDRDGRGRDTVVLSSLPTSITAYLSSNYATDVLVKAFVGRDTSYIVITKDTNGQLYANIFSAAGLFVERKLLAHGNGRGTPVADSALLSSITTYLTNTYPGYTFKAAFSLSANGAVVRYVVLIDANSSKYAVEFDASGVFIEAHVIR